MPQCFWAPGLVRVPRARTLLLLSQPFLLLPRRCHSACFPDTFSGALTWRPLFGICLCMCVVEKLVRHFFEPASGPALAATDHNGLGKHACHATVLKTTWLSSTRTSCKHATDFKEWTCAQTVPRNLENNNLYLKLDSVLLIANNTLQAEQRTKCPNREDIPAISCFGPPRKKKAIVAVPFEGFNLPMPRGCQAGNTQGMDYCTQKGERLKVGQEHPESTDRICRHRDHCMSDRVGGWMMAKNFAKKHKGRFIRLAPGLPGSHCLRHMQHCVPQGEYSRNSGQC
jgi:hypothetical protein